MRPKSENSPAKIVRAEVVPEAVPSALEPPPELDAEIPPELWPDYGFEEWAEAHLKVLTKDGRLVPFVLNTTQRLVMAEIRRLRALGIPPRLIILKSRQVGISTLVEALFFYHTYKTANITAIVLAHNAKLGKALLRMTKRFFKNMPKEMQGKRKLDNVNEIHFAHNDSRMQVEAVGEVRGYSTPDGHWSEFAFWEDADTTFRALMQGVPRIIESLVVIESTANGVGNKFHEIWQSAVSKSEDATLAPEERGWSAIFVPWFKHEEYRMRPWFIPSKTTHEERVLAKRFGLNMGQIAWRRWCIETNCGGDEQTFNVEYPSTWRDAFLMTGRNVFGEKELAYYLSCVPPDVPRETLPPPSEIEWNVELTKPVVEPMLRGRLRVYEDPLPRHTYIVGADPSEGDRGSDPSPLVVLDQQTMNCVAVWHGRQPPDMLAATGRLLGLRYNEAEIIFEANNHGLSFGQALTQLEYPNVYFRQVSEDSVSGERTEKMGFMTTLRNKHHIINCFRRYARDKIDKYMGDAKYQIRDPALVAEMTTLIYKNRESGSELSHIEARPGHTKDLCMAWSLALYCHRGTMEAPLEPLPELDVKRSFDTYRLLKERDREGAEEFALDMHGMTGQEFEQMVDAIDERARKRRVGGGVEAMR